MINADVTSVLGAMDIYLIDQVMKSRYLPGDVLLDAGCGTGRNLHWFLRNNFDIYAIDADTTVMQNLAKQHPQLPADRFQVGAVEGLPYAAHFFDGIICSAVLHFAKSTAHFFEMMDELYRVLKWHGTIFIRMASDIGIEGRVQPIGEGVFLIPDGSSRFLLTRNLLEKLMHRYALTYLEHFKTVNVNDIRCMSTLVLQKVK